MNERLLTIDERDGLGYNSHLYAVEQLIKAQDAKTLKALKPLLTTIHAQLCGIRMEEGKTPWHSALDESIDKLTAILEEEK